jgi:hypothetical protein
MPETKSQSVTSVTGFGRSCGLRSQSLTAPPAMIHRGTITRASRVPARAVGEVAGGAAVSLVVATGRLLTAS